MFTASHNPAQYNGIKLCLAGAKAGRAGHRARPHQGAWPRAGVPAAPTEPGRLDRQRPARRLRRPRALVRRPVGAARRSRSWPTPPTAWAASSCPAVFDGLPFDLEILYGELDGTFPNHPADPIQPENQGDLQAPGARDRRRRRPRLRRRRRPGVPRRRAGRAALGLDHHGDRRRRRCSTRSPGATILHNLICSKAVPEIVRERGGTPVRTRVGHSFIKAVMAETGAAFGGEHSAHYYFRDNYRADSGPHRRPGRPRAAAAGPACRCRSCASRSSATPTRARSTPRSPTRWPSSSGSPARSPTPTRTASTASPSTSATGGSTCGRRTPSRCCASTSRRPTAAECDAHVAEVLALITAEPGG